MIARPSRPWLLLPFVVACSSEPTAGSDEFPEAAYATVVGEEGALTVEIRTAPTQPPRRGLTTVDLLVTDSTGKPIDGLSLDVVPWMPAMGHGASTKPILEARGEGHYVVSKVSLFMPGSWELRTSMSGPVEDRAIVTFQIP